MASVTHDGHTFSIDGRRVWIVSGTVHYARIPPELWRRRLLAARRCGLNCIETPVVWGLHEPHPGHIEFGGAVDLAKFLKLVHELGMHAIVRVGPYVGEGYDLGGLPSWIIPETKGRLRTADASFLKACSRFASALGAVLAPLQVTKRGPVIAVQSEHEWFFGDDELGEHYLGELLRFLREAGIDLPVLNRNNLFQTVEKEIGCWTGYAGLHTIVRQMREVAPSAPRVVLGLQTGAPDVWGRAPRSQKTPADLVRAACEVLAGGGQFNLAPLHAGTNFGHFAGRLEHAPDAFMTTNADAGAPLSETGGETPAYLALKRVCMFASSFSRVFAHLDPGVRPIVIPPEATAPAIVDGSTGERAKGARPAGRPSMSLVHAAGTQGSVVFAFGDGWSVGKPQRCDVLLADGSALPVELGEHGVGWMLLDAQLHGRAMLDYCTFNALARVGRVFVCYAAAGATGVLAINGSALELVAPTGKDPVITEHEGTTVVVLNESQADSCFVEGETIYLGAAGLDDDGVPIGRGKQKVTGIIGASGEWCDAQTSAPAATPKAALGEWSYADTAAYIDGSSERYARIEGPSSMEALGQPSGYGWVRLQMRSGASRKVKAGLFESADRVHVYFDSQHLAIVGQGPGAVWEEVPLSLKRGDHTMTVLVDNLGRLSGGSGMGEAKGVFGHIWEVGAFRAGASKLEAGEPLDPAVTHAPFFGLTRGEHTSPDRLTWHFKHLKKSPVILLVDRVPTPGLVIVNDVAVAPLIPGCVCRVLLGAEGSLKRGGNTVQLALVTGDMASHEKELRAATRFFEGKDCLSESASWAYAKWEAPSAGVYGPVVQATLSGRGKSAYSGRPAWWRASLEVSAADVPLRVDLSGLSKGVIFLNGRAVGRYFVATATGATVPPQATYYLPEPWLRVGKPNELVLFDEHGATPDKVKLVYERA